MALIGTVKSSDLRNNPFQVMTPKHHLGRSRTACQQDIAAAEQNLKRAQARLARAQQAEQDNEALHHRNRVIITD